MIRFRTLALAPLLGLFSLGAWAEQAPVGPEAQHSEDPTAYDQGRYLGTPWASGGAGDGARTEMMQELGDYNLRLEFAVQEGNYLADVAVTIAGQDGGPVVRAFSSGPWFMTKLPAGTYDVRVSGFGRTFEETVQVPATGMESVVFNQWTRQGVAQATPGPYY